MSSDTPVLTVENVSKCFHIYNSSKQRLKQLILPGSQKRYQEFWALQDVSFQVQAGQAVGIIGENGSGKSTLLQIITGTMFPTLGTVDTRGRVAALLELGSGFNPEFTGRENVFMNGSLLGISRARMEEKFDYIAGFADIGIHLDQPVKTYSSGMMLRLAFAVQIAIETELLIIDEALAVGDARFQTKCFRRLDELKSNGTTILFVSHAVELVRSFCDYGLVLEKGRATYWGDARTATMKYLASIYPNQKTAETLPSDVPVSRSASELIVVPDAKKNQTFGVGGAWLNWLKLGGDTSANFMCAGDKATVQCEIAWDVAFVKQLAHTDGYAEQIGIGLVLADKRGNFIFGCNAYDAGLEIGVETGKATLTFEITWPSIAAGEYFYTLDITIGNADRHMQLIWYDCLTQVECIPSQKKVFGMLAVDYTLNTEVPVHAG